MINAPVAKLKVVLDETGHGSVQVNGMEISHIVSAIEFKTVGGGVTETKLTINAELDAEITAFLEKIALAEATPKPQTVRLADGRELTVRTRTA